MRGAGDEIECRTCRYAVRQGYGHVCDHPAKVRGFQRSGYGLLHPRPVIYADPGWVPKWCPRLQEAARAETTKHR